MSNGEDPYCQNPITEKRRVTTKKEKAFLNLFTDCGKLFVNNKNNPNRAATDRAGQGEISKEFKKKQKNMKKEN